MFSDVIVKPAGLQSRILFFFVRTMAQFVKKKGYCHMTLLMWFLCDRLIRLTAENGSVREGLRELSLAGLSETSASQINRGLKR